MGGSGFQSLIAERKKSIYESMFIISCWFLNRGSQGIKKPLVISIWSLIIIIGLVLLCCRVGRSGLYNILETLDCLEKSLKQNLAALLGMASTSFNFYSKRIMNEFCHDICHKKPILSPSTTIVATLYTLVDLLSPRLFLFPLHWDSHLRSYHTSVVDHRSPITGVLFIFIPSLL